MRRLQHNAAAGAVAVDSLQLVTAELAEEVGARQVHRAVAVFRRHFALGLLAHAQNRVEQKRERREARDEQHSGLARLRLARRRSSVDQAHPRACFSLQALQLYLPRPSAAVVIFRTPGSANFCGALRARLRSVGGEKADEGNFMSPAGPAKGASAPASAVPVRPPSRAGAARPPPRSSSSLARALGEHGLGHGPHVAADCAPAQWCSDVDGVCWARGRSGGVRRHLGRDRLPEPGL